MVRGKGRKDGEGKIETTGEEGRERLAGIVCMSVRTRERQREREYV